MRRRAQTSPVVVNENNDEPAVVPPIDTTAAVDISATNVDNEGSAAKDCAPAKQDAPPNADTEKEEGAKPANEDNAAAMGVDSTSQTTLPSTGSETEADKKDAEPEVQGKRTSSEMQQGGSTDDSAAEKETDLSSAEPLTKKAK